jgi:hypothetical protein
MKSIIAYGLISKKKCSRNLVTICEKLPIYWLREVAEQDSIKYDCDVVEVIVSEIIHSKPIK